MSQNNENILINRVANSGLITINLESFLPEMPMAIMDIKDYLFQELLLKEKDFRLAMKSHDWFQYEGRVLCVYCSTDAIVPVWAYMLIAAHAGPYTAEVFFGTEKGFIEKHVLHRIEEIDTADYEEKRVVIKGCGDKWVPDSAYLKITEKLQPAVQSLMYGEPCSTVPIFKRPRKLNS